jgi:SAM-dependent methyltransferase
MRSDYGVTAEFYDLLTDDHLQSVRKLLSAVLASADPGAGPVVDLGAGTGLVTEVVADALPGAKIIAVEPSPAMRAALVTRLASRPELRSRVSVRAAGLADADLPERFGAVTAFGMLGHLDADGRAALWRLLAERLAPGCPAVVQLLPPHTAEPVPQTMGTATRLGDDQIEGWMSAVVVDPETLHWTMTYRVRRDDAVVREEVAEFDWHPIGPDEVVAEATAAGLSCTALEEHLVVLRSGRSPR